MAWASVNPKQEDFPQILTEKAEATTVHLWGWLLLLYLFRLSVKICVNLWEKFTQLARPTMSFYRMKPTTQ